MHKMKILAASALAVASVVGPNASAATFIVDSTTNSPLQGANYSTFNNRTLGNATQTTGTGITVSFTGGGAFVTGSSNGLYSAPIISNGNGANFGAQPNGVDTTTYISTGIGSATLTFATPVKYFGLLWGSIDTYNSLVFNTVDGMSQTFMGSQFLAGSSAGTTSKYINFTSSSAITSVTASSNAYAFEFDNVASAVPEPASWAMMIIGVGAVGFAMRRRKVTTRVSYAA